MKKNLTGKYIQLKQLNLNIGLMQLNLLKLHVTILFKMNQNLLIIM